MNILITGGRSDMAKAMAKKLEVAHQIWVTTSQQDKIQAIEQEYKSLGINIEGVCYYNFSSPFQSCDRLDHLVEKELEGLILNSFTRLPPLRKLHQMKLTVIEEEFEKNITGNINLIHRALPKMLEKQFGRLLLISSASVENGSSLYPTYIAAKAALEGLFKNLAVDYGSFNILSNVLKLGIIQTSRTQKFWKKDEYQKKMGRIIPQGKLGTPQEVANALPCFFDREQYINGSSLFVTGGLPMMQSKGILES